MSTIIMASSNQLRIPVSPNLLHLSQLQTTQQSKIRNSCKASIGCPRPSIGGAMEIQNHSI